MVTDTDAWHDDEEAGTPTCQACGVPFVKHLGIIGTCAELQHLKKIIAAALKTYESEKSSLRCCIEMAGELKKANL